LIHVYVKSKSIKDKKKIHLLEEIRQISHISQQQYPTHRKQLRTANILIKTV